MVGRGDGALTSPPVAVLAANRGYALASSRRLLVTALLAQGWRVVLATADDEHARQLEALGAEIERIAFARSGLAPMTDLRAYRRFRRLLRALRPDLLHCFHAKPVILGGLAAAGLAETTVVHTITGLGQAFERPGVRWLAATGYRRVLSRAAAVIFQNPDDRDLFLARGWAPLGRSHLLRGSGVDLERFHPRAGEPVEESVPRVLFAARLLWPKGVAEFVEAARLLAPRWPSVRFQIAGELDPGHPQAVPETWLEEKAEEGVIEYLGYRPRFEEDLLAATIFALPSYYREGVPRVGLEAAACALPVVAADAPGSRETVVDGDTGLLVPPRDAGALARAIETLLEDPARARAMGEAGRRRVEADFDLRRLTLDQLEIYRAAGAPVEPQLAPVEVS